MQLKASNNFIDIYSESYNNFIYQIEVLKQKNNTFNIRINNNIMDICSNKENIINILNQTIINLNNINKMNNIDVNNSNFMIVFEVANKEEMSQITNISNEFNLDADIIITMKRNPYNINMKGINEEKEKIEKYFKLNEIIKLENGKMRKFVERKSDSKNFGYLLEDINVNDMMIEFNEIQEKEPSILQTLSEEQLANKILDNISKKQNKKEYYLENSLNQFPKDNDERITLNSAEKDSTLNTDIGFIKKDEGENHENDYRVINVNGEEREVVEPTVNSISAGTSINSSISSGDVANSVDNVEPEEKEVNKEEVEQVFYFDSSTGEIYNEERRLIGNIQEGKYQVDYDTNYLKYNGGVLGPIGDIKDMGKDKGNELSKPKKLVLEKENVSAGIISIIFLPIIIFIAISIALIIK